jgi:diacylglycerol kinase family enzyme
MIAGATTELKQRWGVATYFVTGARAVFARQTFRLRATVDGRVSETDAWAVFVANFGPVLGGLMHLGPDVSPDDGALDLCVYSPATIRDALAVTWRMFRNDFRPHPCMRFVRGRDILVETTPVRPFQSDGELVGETPMRLRVEPRALMVLAPDTRR